MSDHNQGSQGPSNAALERLAVFVGEWNIEITAMSFQADKTAVAHGHTSFDWIEGGAFLIQHSEVPDSDFPSGISIMGPDDKAETYSMLYFDSRGVSRIYQMSLSADTWKLWRDFPGFSQRFTATFSDDHNGMYARWEKSSDGSNWELDFNETYTRVESTKV
jgi:hypothetical protein